MKRMLQTSALLLLLLAFTERNPGITRILTGDALAGETERLHTRVAQLFDRFETQLKQVIREAEMREGLRPSVPLPVAANLLMAAAEGRISQYVRSGFKRLPTQDWKPQWDLLMTGFFREAVSQPVPGSSQIPARGCVIVGIAAHVSPAITSRANVVLPHLQQIY